MWQRVTLGDLMGTHLGIMFAGLDPKGRLAKEGYSILGDLVYSKLPFGPLGRLKFNICSFYVSARFQTFYGDLLTSF